MKKIFSYQQFFEELENSTVIITSNEELQLEIHQLQKRKAELETLNNQKQVEHEKLEAHLNTLTECQASMEVLERDYWRSYALLCAQRNKLIMDEQSTINQLEYSVERLDKIRCSFALNDTFHIWHSDGFVTINHCKLQRLGNGDMDSNAAWGMAVMLLDNIAKLLNFKYDGYSLLTCGSQSKILRIKDNTEHELFDREGIFRILSGSRYDAAMRVFVDCVGQLIRHVTQMDSAFLVPYELTEDDKYKIIKYAFTDLKFLLSWLANLSHAL